MVYRSVFFVLVFSVEFLFIRSAFSHGILNHITDTDSVLFAPSEPIKFQAEELAKVAEVQEVKHIGNALTVTFKGDEGFNPGSVELTSEGRATIGRMAQVIRTVPNQRIRIEVYTDTSGKKAENMRLSLVRAEQVKSVLLANGLKPETVSAKGFGAAFPISNNESRLGRCRNRRLLFVIENQEIDPSLLGESPGI